MSRNRGPETEVERRPDGAILMRNAEPLGPYPRVLTERLAESAARDPGRVLLAERDGAGAWRKVSHAEAWQAIRAIGQALLDRGLGPDRPLAILSGGSVAHGLLALAATHAGVPYCPVSPAYSLLASSSDRLDHVLGLLRPGAVYVEDHAAFAPRLAESIAPGVEVIANGAVPAGVTPFEDLLAARPGPGLDAAHAAIGQDDTRMILFTSGTTGPPKGVITTHRMTCANQQMFMQSFPAFAAEPPVLLSWLPWHHTSGASCILGAVVHGGGSLWIDGGRPVAGAPMKETLRNLREIAPTAYFSAPAGFALLTEALRSEAELRSRFFSRLRFFFYSGAAMPAPLAADMDAIATAETGAAVPFFSCYGATETAPFTLAVSWPGATGGLAGLPMPGVTLKLTPVDGLLEARLSGPTVTPGYLGDPAATGAAFDEEGFYRYGDALAPLDPGDPARGLAFDGRIGENFKLSTGTWVNVAGLREQLLNAAEGLIADAVIVGEGEAEVGALLFLDAERAAAPGAERTRRRVAEAMQVLADAATGSSTFVARALIQADPPDPVAGEVADKGSVSQRAVLRRRAGEVARIYGDTADVIRPAGHPGGAGDKHVK